MYKILLVSKNNVFASGLLTVLEQEDNYSIDLIEDISYDTQICCDLILLHYDFNTKKKQNIIENLKSKNNNIKIMLISNIKKPENIYKINFNSFDDTIFTFSDKSEYIKKINKLLA